MAWFQADSGMNLIKQGDYVTCLHDVACSSVVECWHSKRETLGSSPPGPYFPTPMSMQYTDGKGHALEG